MWFFQLLQAMISVPLILLAALSLGFLAVFKGALVWGIPQIWLINYWHDENAKAEAVLKTQDMFEKFAI